MTLKITKKEQILQREKHVLACARRMISEYGLIGFKMPDLAKESEISIGALYRHFESREDLVTAVAQYALHTRHTKLLLVNELFDSPINRLIAIPLLDFLFNVAHREAFQTETCCMNASFVALASDKRRLSFRAQGDRVASLIEKAITAVNSTGVSVSCAEGIWSLISGTSLIWYSQARTVDLKEALNFFRPHLIGFLRGYLPNLNVTIEDIIKIEQILLDHADDWRWSLNGDSYDED